jgi:hypothetical protein
VIAYVIEVVLGDIEALVRAVWDEEAHVWVATTDEVPGFRAKADTIEQLRAKALGLLEELVELNS